MKKILNYIPMTYLPYLMIFLICTYLFIRYFSIIWSLINLAKTFTIPISWDHILFEFIALHNSVLTIGLKFCIVLRKRVPWRNTLSYINCHISWETCLTRFCYVEFKITSLTYAMPNHKHILLSRKLNAVGRVQFSFL